MIRRGRQSSAVGLAGRSTDEIVKREKTEWGLTQWGVRGRRAGMNRALSFPALANHIACPDFLKTKYSGINKKKMLTTNFTMWTLTSSYLVRVKNDESRL